MVKVVKVAAWKIGDRYIEDAKEAERATRELVIRELLTEWSANGSGDPQLKLKDSIANWVAENWDAIESRTKAAMAGT